MRVWGCQKVIGFDVCKIMILTGHDIQMTWQPSISINVYVSILQIVLSNTVGFSSWVGNLSGFLATKAFFCFFPVWCCYASSNFHCLEIKWFPSLILMIADHQWMKSRAKLTVRQSFNQSTLALASLSLQSSPCPSHNPLLCAMWCSVSTGTVITATINRINQRWHWALWSRWRV